jgi:hypothetical protein
MCSGVGRVTLQPWGGAPIQEWREGRHGVVGANIFVADNAEGLEIVGVLCQDSIESQHKLKRSTLFGAQNGMLAGQDEGLKGLAGERKVSLRGPGSCQLRPQDVNACKHSDVILTRSSLLSSAAML